MPPYLKITAGNNLKEELQQVQTNRYPVVIANDLFEGILVVRINNFDESHLPDPAHLPPSQWSNLNTSQYFANRSRQFSFQIEGRFKQPVNGDDLYWDISFPSGLTGLPFFTPMVVKFLQYLDPATEIDFYGNPQYVRSSVLTMMNSIAAWKPLPLTKDEEAVIDETPSETSVGSAEKIASEIDKNMDVDPYPDTSSITSTSSANNLPPPTPILRQNSSERLLQPDTLTNGVTEDLALIISSMRRLSSTTKKDSPPRSDVNKRRKYFLDKKHRENVTFLPEYVYAFESFNPHMCWPDFTAKIPGFNIDVKKYFKGGKKVGVRLCSKDGNKVYLGMILELVEEEGMENGNGK